MTPLASEAVRPAAGSGFAHVRAGACDVAVPVADIVRVVPLPAAGLTPLPRRSGALAGLVMFEGSVVPVVGLDRWVALGTANAANPASTACKAGTVSNVVAARVVILSTGQALIGFLADTVLGVHRVDAGTVRPVHHDADGDELFAAVVPATGARPLLQILEVARLMALAQAWCEQAQLRPGQAATAASARRDVAGVRYALFGIGHARWAIPAAAIARLVTTPAAEIRLSQQLVCGIGASDGRKLAMVDLAFAPGTQGAARPCMAIVQEGPLLVGVVVDRCDRLVDLAEADIVKVPGDRLLAGTAIVDGVGPVSVLAPDKLFRAVPEASISLATAAQGGRRAWTAAAATPAAAAVPAGGASHYLVFEADRPYASPVVGLMGVVALPAAAIDDLAAGRHATIAWRGQTLAVVNMPSIDAGQARPLHPPRLAVVVEGEHAGLAASAIAIRSLVDWLPAHAARHGRMRLNGIGDVDVITSQRAQQAASLVVVDLAQMTYLLN